MTEKERTCLFTGHRPERLTIQDNQVKEWLNEQIKEAMRDGYTNFIF